MTHPGVLLASREHGRSVSQHPSPHCLLPREGVTKLIGQVPGHTIWVSSVGLLVGRITVCSKVVRVGTELSLVPFSLKNDGPLSLGKPVMLLLLASLLLSCY